VKKDFAKRLLSSLEMPQEFLQKAIEDLDFMARYKYDHYEMFAPATRFFEHLYLWLKQFDTPHERQRAIEFILGHLIFISQREMQDLARFLYYDVIVKDILQEIIRREGLKPFEYAKAFVEHFPTYLRHCLFIGLSDGAQINFFRRHNIELSQEQIIPYYRTSDEDYLDKLRSDTNNIDAKFWGVFLIDDFTASAYTLIHEEKETGNMVGALQRVYKHHADVINGASLVRLCHYISTEHAQRVIRKRAQKMPEYGSFQTNLLRLFLGLAIKRPPKRVKYSKLVLSASYVTYRSKAIYFCLPSLLQLSR
jgi:hypothetical protein